MVLGITGKYCAGKDALVSLLVDAGIREINEDRVGHTALTARAEEVAAAFGEGVLSSDGTIDRKSLGALVFSDSEALSRLEGILHPWMVDETRRLLQSSVDQSVAINAAILHRMRLHLLCDLIIIVHAPLITRVRRGLRRDHHGVLHILRRIWSQRRDDIPKHFLNERGARVDTVVVKNGGSREALARRLEAILSDFGITGR